MSNSKKEVDGHITQRYEIKKRIGKGVSTSWVYSNY